MKKPTNENMIPKWIADLFKTKKEKRSEQEQLDLDRYVADLRMNDPEKYEKLQSILKHVDPDTGQLPTGLNTAGSMDESIASDLIDAGFKTWEYTDETGRSFYPKGRNEKEAALWLRLKHKIKVDPSQIKLADRSGLGYADDTTIDIYNQKYQPDDVMENRLRKIVKELMADLPPTEKVSTMPGQDIKDQMISAVSATNDVNILKQLSIVFGGAGFKDSDNLGEMKRKLMPLMSKAGAGQYLKLAQKFAVENGEIVMKSAKQDVAFMKETLMKKIREAFDMSMRTVNPEFVYHVQVKKNGDIVTTYNGVGGDKANQLVNAKQRGLVSADSIRSILGSNSEVEDGTYTVLVSTDSQNNRGTIKLDKADSLFIQDKGTKVNENKMKVTQLKQIIREEIQKVMEIERSAELFIQGADPMSDSFRADSGPGSELADELYYDKRYSTQIPKKDLIIALKNFGLDDVVDIVNTIPGDALSFSRDQLYYGGPGKIMISPMRKPNVSDPEIEKFKDAEFRRNYPNRSLDPRSTD